MKKLEAVQQVLQRSFFGMLMDLQVIQRPNGVVLHMMFSFDFVWALADFFMALVNYKQHRFHMPNVPCDLQPLGQWSQMFQPDLNMMKYMIRRLHVFVMHSTCRCVLA